MFRQILKYTGSVIRELKKLVYGTFRFAAYLLSKDKITVSLSQFSTVYSEAEIGKESIYEAIISNNTNKNLWLKLLVDIYVLNNQVHPEGHYAYFEKSIFIQAHECIKNKIIYNWLDNAIFEIDGVQFYPNNEWNGCCDLKGKYIIIALLRDENGNTYEKLTLVQEVSQ